MDADDAPPRPLPQLVVSGLLALWAVLFNGLWLRSVWAQREAPDVWQRDWYALWEAGGKLWAHDLGTVYPPRGVVVDYPWLYPPYALYPAGGLALLPPGVAYAGLVAGVIALTAGALHLLGRALDAPLGPIVPLTFASMGFFWNLMLGQNGPWWLLAVAAAFWALSQDRPVVAGLALALLGFKPTLAVWAVAWLALGRRWKALGTMAAVGVGMIAVSLPLGTVLWVDWFDAGARWTRLTLADYPFWKLVTWTAVPRSFGLGGALVTAWDGLGLALTLGAAGWVAWRGTLPHQAAALGLWLCLGSPYVVHYDSLVLAVPAAVWWTRRAAYAPSVWWAMTACVVGAFAWPWVGFLGVAEASRPSLSGAFLLGWLLLEAIHAFREPRP